MKTVMCLLAALAGADAAVVTCGAWSGTCPPAQEKMGEGRCVNAVSDLPPMEEVPLCAHVCCRYPTCPSKVSCPTGYTVNAGRQCSAVNVQNSDGVRYCSQQTCCDTTCGVAVTCPANTGTDAQKKQVCSANPDYPRRCDVATCCASTCASYTCPANYDSKTAAGVACTAASDARGGRSSDTLAAATCTTDLCCRTTCKSNAYKCPAGSGYGKHEFRGCRTAGGAEVESPLPVCSNAVCCEVISKCPAGFVCPANTKQKADVTKADCFGDCEAADCCVDVPVTCAAAQSKCTGTSTLKGNPSTIACGLSAIAPAADACTREKCCNVKVFSCANDAACRADGDSAATCQNGACLCTLLYTRTAEQTCVLNRLFFAATFANGDYSKLTAAHRDAVSVALTKKLTKLLALQFSQGSIVIAGEAETRVGSVSDAEIVDAVKGAVPASVLGTKSQITVGGASNVCKSADAGAVTAVKAPFASGAVCVPTLCNVPKGYAAQPVAHKCVLMNARVSNDSDDDLSTGAKVGIALGVIGFVAIVVGIAVLVVLKGRSAGSAQEPNEPATNAQKELPSGQL
eukprot:Rhum_TRINITY_DN14856_c1_g2::Rhum_TRINITY_DN14856_c1_g2_i4::g.124200::m.124200